MMSVERFLSNDLISVMFDLAYSSYENREFPFSFYNYVCEQVTTKVPEIDGFYYDKYFENVVVDVKIDVDEKEYPEVARKVEEVFWEAFNDKNGYCEWKRKRIEELIVKKAKELSTKSSLREGLHIIEDIINLTERLQEECFGT